MRIIKRKDWSNVPGNYTGIVKVKRCYSRWYKNGDLHREDGPAYFEPRSNYSVWWLDGELIWSSYDKLDLTDQIILSKTKHPKYPTAQVWKILEKDKVYERIIIPGMEELIIE